MSDVISRQDWQQLPEKARREVLDFFLFVKARYAKQAKMSETALLSEHALAEDWLNKDEAWASLAPSS